MKKLKYLLFLLAIAGVQAAQAQPFERREIMQFEQPWAMTFLPDGRLLVTEKPGRLILVSLDDNEQTEVANVPSVDYGGQGGLGDIILHPDYAVNKLVYLSYAEAGENNTRGAVVIRAKLILDKNAGTASLTQIERIWTQHPKVTGRGHYGHRLAFDQHGFLFISSGERQKFDPSQDMNANLGKIIRLHADGSVPQDNPFYADGGIASQVWSLGHRNPLGLAFDAKGRLWNSEMGPLHGDEFNLVKESENYGYPIVSNGDHYNGDPIPDHDTRPEFEAPAAYWVPSIAPAEVIYYSGSVFPEWQGSFLIAGLKSQAIIRVTTNGETAQEVERFNMGARIREIEQGPDGAVWVLEDGSNAKLLKLTPKDQTILAFLPAVLAGSESKQQTKRQD
ncbi:dehydrogenase [Arenicella chitinivorans]|uniref:Dehydrogenase n=1 Tax=Arenicella chitinivorans TaxID=1329800 RepID=A0A918VGL2_9GAMM|nr:PQQ-dependent sugar dehydrogenase [Arenicella chitinivorans]GGZ96148.1 dehydrogenase [Arenicella chitinivorans]